MIRLIALAALAALTLPAETKREAALKQAEKDWAEATVKADRAGLEKILADELIYTHSNGESDTKKVFIDNMFTGVRKYLKIEHGSMEVRDLGNTGVISATARIETSAKGGPASAAHLRFLHVWVLRGGRWQLAGHQSLRLPN